MSVQVQATHILSNSRLLIALAIERAKEASKSDFETLSAVILAIASLEAFVNEFPAFVDVYGNRKFSENEWKYDALVANNEQQLTANKRIDAFRWDLLNVALEVGMRDNSRLWDKYEAIFQGMNGHAVIQGKGTGQKLQALIKLRNTIVHSKPREYETIKTEQDDTSTSNFDSYTLVSSRFPKHPCFEPLRSYRLVEPFDERCPTVLQICDQRVATWACETVQQASDELLDTLPLSPLRIELQRQTLAGFGKEWQ